MITARDTNKSCPCPARETRTFRCEKFTSNTPGIPTTASSDPTPESNFTQVSKVNGPDKTNSPSIQSPSFPSRRNTGTRRASTATRSGSAAQTVIDPIRPQSAITPERISTDNGARTLRRRFRPCNGMRLFMDRVLANPSGSRPASAQSIRILGACRAGVATARVGTSTPVVQRRDPTSHPRGTRFLALP